MVRQSFGHLIKVGVLIFMVVGCAGLVTNHGDHPFSPPAYADPVAAIAMEKGNHLFAGQRWEAAMEQYEAAIQAQTSLGEAHFNLALALYVQGRYEEARPHFVKAVKLEPGNPVIRNAPPFRMYGTVEEDAELDSSHDHSGHHH